MAPTRRPGCRPLPYDSLLQKTARIESLEPQDIDAFKTGTDKNNGNAGFYEGPKIGDQNTEPYL